MLCISLCTLQNYQIKAATEHFKGILPSKTLSKDTTGMFVWQDIDLCSVLLAADWLEYWWTAWRYCSDWLNKDPGRFCWWTQTAQKARVRFWCRNQTEFISDQVSAAVMHLFMFSLLVVIGLQVESTGGRSERSIERSFTSLLRVHNGMKFGSWGHREYCPIQMYAAGFSLKVSWALTHET